MAENKKSFVLYADLIHTVRKMNKEQAGELFLTILGYVNDENPVPENPIVDLVFEPVKRQLKRDLEAWENERKNRSEAGKKGMENRWHGKQPITTDNSVTPVITKITDNVTVTDTVNANVNDTVTATVNENVNPSDIKPAPAKKSRKKSEPKKQPMSFRDSEYFDKEKFCAALAHSPPPYCHADADFYYDKMLNSSDSKGYQYIDWLATTKNWISGDIQKGIFKSRISEPIKIIHGGKSENNYQKRAKGAGYSDRELADALAKVSGSNIASSQ